jgi:hypothetical protein
VKYVVTIEVGDIEVSCEAGSKEEVLSGLDELIELSQKVAERVRARPVTRPSRRRGKSEAVEVLKLIEEKLLPTDFFNQPRSTADVRQKLYDLVKIKFQSRKVSQALGILYDKDILSRIGLKGEYKYFVKR